MDILFVVVAFLNAVGGGRRVTTGTFSPTLLFFEAVEEQRGGQ